jgi:hypothetical protein
VPGTRRMEPTTCVHLEMGTKRGTKPIWLCALVFFSEGPVGSQPLTSTWPRLGEA